MLKREAILKRMASLKKRPEIKSQAFYDYDFILKPFRKISSIKHHFVMDDCNRLIPTKAAINK